MKAWKQEVSKDTLRCKVCNEEFTCKSTRSNGTVTPCSIDQYTRAKSTGRCRCDICDDTLPECKTRKV